MNNIIIETVDLTKIYTMGSEKIAAVDHVNLTVERNTYYCRSIRMWEINVTWAHRGLG